MVLKYFGSSFAWTAIALIGAFILGGVQAAYIVLILSLLEISLSFDNAVVNAKVLKDMSKDWQQRFITWGMVVAVFGMRVLFPLGIVSVMAHISPWAATTLAIEDPEKYKAIISGAHTSLMAFGGTFLLMVFAKFFIDEEKDVHWFGPLERRLTVLGKIEAIQAASVLLIAYIISRYLPSVEEANTFITASLFGLITYILVNGIGAFFNDENLVGKTGISAFIYLEVLDSSFSFDGVLSSFLFSNNLFIIATGLGVGALFVRSLTLLMVKKGTVDEFIYLEHGAHWSIGAIAIFMFFETLFEIPELVTGLTSIVILLLSFGHSIYVRR
jgi:hypothetical protein